MNRKALLVCAAAVVMTGIVPAAARAQTEGLVIGVLGGVDWSTFGLECECFNGEVKSIVGGLAGLTLRRAIKGRLGAELDALFTQKGTRFLSEFDTDLKIRLNEFELPVLAQYELYRRADRRVHAGAGPAFGFRINHHETLDGEDAPENLQVDLKSFEFGIAFGGGFSHRRLGVGARFTLGLTNINAAETATEAKTRTFALFVTWLLKELK